MSYIEEQRARQTKEFLETIDALAASAIAPEHVLILGRADLASVLAALDHGHRCLAQPHLVGDTGRVFLQLILDALGMARFMRLRHEKLNPALIAQFVNDLLYDAPAHEALSDDELRDAMECLGKIHDRLAPGVLRILADRKTAKATALQSC